jgi:hypothetical protein
MKVILVLVIVLLLKKSIQLFQTSVFVKTISTSILTLAAAFY